MHNDLPSALPDPHPNARPVGSKWLFLAIALFLLQALPLLSYRWVTDESWYAAPGYSIAHGNGIKDPAIGPNDLENHLDVRPPGTALVIAGFFKLAGAGAVQARLGSILAGLAIVILTWTLTRDILGGPGAAFATLIVATDNLIVLTSRSARPEALTAMSILLAMLAMKLYFQNGRLLWAFLSGLALALGTMFHITLLGYIVSLFFAALIIDRARGRFLLRGVSAYVAGYAIGLIPFAAWILTTQGGKEAFAAEYLSHAVKTSLFGRLLQEQRRYSDLLGLHMLHGHGLDALPVRLPIPLFFLVATFLLWKYRRRWFYLELLLLVPSVLWLIYTFNKSSRYLALLAPLFAIAMGAAIAATQSRPKLQRILSACAVLVILAQLGANLLLLHSARAANYSKLTTQLQSIIPPNETAYGTITFWMALHDRGFIAYERTDPASAATLFHARYFISGDRMMANAGVFGDQSFSDTRRDQLAALQSRSDLVGQIDDPYYGDLTIYKLRP